MYVYTHIYVCVCKKFRTAPGTCVCTKSLQLCLTLCHPMDCSPPGSSVHGDSPGKNTGVGCCAPLHALPDPGIEPISPKSPAFTSRFCTTSALWEALIK